MPKRYPTTLMAMALALPLTLATTAQAQEREPTMGYNHKIPEKIMTPDAVETSIGTLNFFDGMPDEATTDLLYDNLLRLRGVEAFLNGIPATSIEGLRLGHLDLGIEASNEFILYGPLEPWFEKTWRPGEIELAD